MLRFQGFECSHDAIFKMYRLEFRFQNLPGKLCRFRVTGKPIRHLLHHFQNVPASYERSLKKYNATFDNLVWFKLAQLAGVNGIFEYSQIRSTEVERLFYNEQKPKSSKIASNQLIKAVQNRNLLLTRLVEMSCSD